MSTAGKLRVFSWVFSPIGQLTKSMSETTSDRSAKVDSCAGRRNLERRIMRKKQMKSLLIFAHHNTTGHLPDYVKTYVNELGRFFSDVVVATNYNGNFDSYQVQTFSNEGYDFGLFYKALVEVNLDTYERIAFVNDSNVLLGSFDRFFEWLDSQSFDLAGLTDSREYPVGRIPRINDPFESYHIQSHFLVFENQGIPEIFHFFEDVEFEKYLIPPSPQLRHTIIDKCEIGLSQYFLKKNLQLGSMFRVDTWARDKIKGRLGPNDVPLDWKSINMHILLWEELIHDGYPLIKTRIIRGESGFPDNRHKDYYRGNLND